MVVKEERDVEKSRVSDFAVKREVDSKNQNGTDNEMSLLQGRNIRHNSAWIFSPDISPRFRKDGSVGEPEKRN